MSQLSITAAGVKAKGSKGAKSKGAKSTPAASAPAVTTPPPILGEIICAKFPRHYTISHQDLMAHLGTAGFDAKLARNLCPAYSFIRAVRALAAQRIVRNVDEKDDAKVTFQFTREKLDLMHGQARLAYDCEALVTLDKGTGAVTCTDAAMEALAKSEMQKQADSRNITDVRRLLNRIITSNGDVFAFDDGVQFIPEKHAAFLDQLDTLVKLLGGDLRRVAVPSGNAATLTTIQTVMVDNIGDAIHEYEEALKEVNAKIDTLSEKQAAAAQRKIHDAYRLVRDYRDFLGAHATMLEDHVAYIDSLHAKALADAAAAKKAPAAPPASVPVP